MGLLFQARANINRTTFFIIEAGFVIVGVLFIIALGATGFKL